MRSRSHLAAWAALTSLVLATTGCAPLVIGGAATAGAAAAQDRGITGAVADTAIQAQINHLWFQHDVELHRRLDMTVQDGRVLLIGRAATPEMRLDAVRLAWQADGVQEVINEIQVEDSAGIQGMAQDAWISAQLRSKLMFDREVSSINYTIDTVDGVVYLMGRAKSQQELERVTGHASTIPHVKRVVSYVRL